MAADKFGKEPLSERQRGLVRMRSITNYSMGVFIIAAGFFFIFPTKYTAEFLNKYDESMMLVLGIVCWIYGLFRIYRGYDKNYFND